MLAIEQKVSSLDTRFLSDLVALTKPKITLMAVLVACAGVMNADGDHIFVKALFALVGIAALVSGSSALNMYLEREQDKKMVRTKDRPLPSGRMASYWAVLVGVFCSLSACFLLYAATNWLTLILGIFSLIAYVFCYTPLKQKTWTSLIIGSVPGAMPVMLGYTSFANVVDFKVLSLFFWAFLWQVPHFLAISLFREREYTNAGFPVMSARFNEDIAKITLLLTSWLLVASTVGLYAASVISMPGLIVSLALGAVFLVTCHRGAFSESVDAWAKRAFKASLNYQGLLFVILIVSALF